MSEQSITDIFEVTVPKGISILSYLKQITIICKLTMFQ